MKNPGNRSLLIETMFTRYLYYIPDVEFSLETCLATHQVDKALFWAYELYFSGLEDEVFLLVARKKPAWKTMIEEKRKEWLKNRQKHALVASMIHTVCQPRFSFRVNYDNRAIEKYKTLQNQKPYRLLREACIYATDKVPLLVPLLVPFSVPFSVPLSRDTLLSKYFYHWEYYAFLTPVWRKRIEKHGGIVVHETQRVVFLNDELEDLFYENYGYEPDEQPREITERTVLETEEE